VELSQAQQEGQPAVATEPSALGYVRSLRPRTQLLVAGASAVLAAGCFVRFGLSGRAAVESVFAAVLVLLTAIDLQRRLIPNVIVLPTLVGVLVAQIALSPDRTVEWVVASGAAALFLFIPLLIYPAGMGMGDVKLAALLGAALGKAVILAVIAGLFTAGAFGVLILVREGVASRKKSIAFGPFLAFGGLVALFLGVR
jgi:leader peptidase (prepilin peptidase) / N-methyltransferase